MQPLDARHRGVDEEVVGPGHDEHLQHLWEDPDRDSWNPAMTLRFVVEICTLANAWPPGSGL